MDIMEQVRAGCDGSSGCLSMYHWHGCYNDVDGSTCEEPEEHKNVERTTAMEELKVGDRVRIVKSVSPSTREDVGKEGVVSHLYDKPGASYPYEVRFDEKHSFVYIREELEKIDVAVIEGKGMNIKARYGKASVYLHDVESARKQVMTVNKCIEALDEYARVESERLAVRRQELAEELYGGVVGLTDVQWRAVVALVEKEDYEER